MTCCRRQALFCNKYETFVQGIEFKFPINKTLNLLFRPQRVKLILRIPWIMLSESTYDSGWTHRKCSFIYPIKRQKVFATTPYHVWMDTKSICTCNNACYKITQGTFDPNLWTRHLSNTLIQEKEVTLRNGEIYLWEPICMYVYVYIYVCTYIYIYKDLVTATFGVWFISVGATKMLARHFPVALLFEPQNYKPSTNTSRRNTFYDSELDW